MNTQIGSVSTWDTLKTLGFQEDYSVISDSGAGLTYQFGNFDLSASLLLNRWFVEVVQLHGILFSSRTMADVWFEIPKFAESYEQVLAYIVWNLDKYSNGNIFIPEHETQWIQEGRGHFSLLPWVRDRLAYESRLKCIVNREWLKLGLKALSEIMLRAGIFDVVQIGFDGEILSFRTAGKLVAIQAEGEPWHTQFDIPVSELSNLPLRLMSPNVSVFVWEEKFVIGNQRFSGCVESKHQNAASNS